MMESILTHIQYVEPSFPWILAGCILVPSLVLELMLLPISELNHAGVQLLRAGNWFFTLVGGSLFAIGLFTTLAMWPYGTVDLITSTPGSRPHGLVIRFLVLILAVAVFLMLLRLGSIEGKSYDLYIHNKAMRHILGLKVEGDSDFDSDEEGDARRLLKEANQGDVPFITRSELQRAKGEKVDSAVRSEKKERASSTVQTTSTSTGTSTTSTSTSTGTDPPSKTTSTTSRRNRKKKAAATAVKEEGTSTEEKGKGKVKQESKGDDKAKAD